MIVAVADSSGVESLWIEQVEPKESDELVKIINSPVKDIKVKDGYENLPYKLSIQFENDMVTFIAAEIYDNADGTWDIKINDEMVLVFEDRRDAEKFETVLKERKR